MSEHSSHLTPQNVYQSFLEHSSLVPVNAGSFDTDARCEDCGEEPLVLEGDTGIIVSIFGTNKLDALHLKAFRATMASLRYQMMPVPEVSNS